MDGCAISGASHDSAQGIDLTDEMAFPDTPNGRIA
jgi:hypothetical protein